MAGLTGKACRRHMLLPGDHLGLRPPLSGGRSKTELPNFSIPENGLSYLFQSLLPSLSALPSLTTGSTALSLAEAEGSRYPQRGDNCCSGWHREQDSVQLSQESLPGKVSVLRDTIFEGKGTRGLGPKQQEPPCHGISQPIWVPRQQGLVTSRRSYETDGASTSTSLYQLCNFGQDFDKLIFPGSHFAHL